MAAVASALAPTAADLRACVYVSMPHAAAAPGTFIFLGWRHGLDAPSLSRCGPLIRCILTTILHERPVDKVEALLAVRQCTKQTCVVN